MNYRIVFIKNNITKLESDTFTTNLLDMDSNSAMDLFAHQARNTFFAVSEARSSGI